MRFKGFCPLFGSVKGKSAECSDRYRVCVSVSLYKVPRSNSRACSQQVSFGCSSACVKHKCEEDLILVSFAPHTSCFTLYIRSFVALHSFWLPCALEFVFQGSCLRGR